jgi:hypothetical protein
MRPHPRHWVRRKVSPPAPKEGEAERRQAHPSIVHATPADVTVRGCFGRGSDPSGDRSPLGALPRRLPRKSMPWLSPGHASRETRWGGITSAEIRACSDAPRAPVIVPAGRCPEPPESGVTNSARRNRTRSVSRPSPVTSLRERDALAKSFGACGCQARHADGARRFSRKFLKDACFVRVADASRNSAPARRTNRKPHSLEKICKARFLGAHARRKSMRGRRRNAEPTRLRRAPSSGSHLRCSPTSPHTRERRALTTPCTRARPERCRPRLSRACHSFSSRRHFQPDREPSRCDRAKCRARQ